MMLEVEQHMKLPRLLDLDDSPSVTRRRRYWRYVHRWRRRLSHLWRQDVPGESDSVEIARGVDDLLAITLLLDYFRRSGHADLPSISALHQRSSRPTPAAIATAITAIVKDSFVSAALDPQTFADTLPVPRRVVAENWQRRLGDATWLLYRDRQIPLSFFGDLHQVCTGNPLNTESPDTEGKGKQGPSLVYVSKSGRRDSSPRRPAWENTERNQAFSAQNRWYETGHSELNVSCKACKL